jgi:hypothetical protein
MLWEAEDTLWCKQCTQNRYLDPARRPARGPERVGRRRQESCREMLDCVASSAPEIVIWTPRGPPSCRRYLRFCDVRSRPRKRHILVQFGEEAAGTPSGESSA